MKTVLKVNTLQPFYYLEIERRLESYAKQGLILKKMGRIFWTFTKEEPQDIQYTVTFFQEGSVFNPEPTDNQMTYFDYAKESGWDFVCELDQLQVFSSKEENPVPFDSDPNEQLKMIHKIMKKVLLFPNLMLLSLVIVNIMSFTTGSFQIVKLLSSYVGIWAMIGYIFILCHSAIVVGDYALWYRKSKKSINLGGDIINPYSKKKLLISSIIFTLFFSFFLVGAAYANNKYLLLSVCFTPAAILLITALVTVQKKWKVPANLNKFITITTYLIIAFSAYGIVSETMLPDNLTQITLAGEREYREVEVKTMFGDIETYRLYKDEIPLTCQDLVGDLDYDYYSYEHTVEESFLLTMNQYIQCGVEGEEYQPGVSYNIYTTPYQWVKDIVVSDLLDTYESFNIHAKLTDNNIFNTVEAYVYQDQDNGRYLENQYVLVYEDRIIELCISINEDYVHGLSDEQIEIIKEKLKIY